MKQTFRFFATLGFVSTAFFGFSATALHPGDIAIVSVSSIAPKSFEFISLIPIKAGTIVKFTDDAWLDSVQSFRGNEGVLTYTFTEDAKAGQTVRWEKDAAGFQSKGTFSLSTSGDNIICYQDTDKMTFIYGIGWAKSTKSNWKYLSSASGATSTSDIPQALSMANNTIAYFGNADSYAYNAESVHSGSKNEILKAISAPSNYTSSNETALKISNLTFTVNDTQEVPNPENPIVIVVVPDIPATDIKITHATAQKISTCQLPATKFADSILYTDKSLSEKFNIPAWKGDDTLLFVADTIGLVLFKDTVILKTALSDNKIEISDGTIADWYKDGQLIATAESINMETAGQYCAYTESKTGCGLKTDTFIAIGTDTRCKLIESHTDMIYIDYLGRIYLSQPSVPYICKQIK